MSAKPITVFVCLLVGACGGTVFTVDPVPDSGPNDGGLSASCPANLPGDGAACASEGIECEYGANAQPNCNTVAVCTNNAWHVRSPAPGGCVLPPPKSCPKSFKDVPVGQGCFSSYPSVCSYPEGTCGCEVSSGGPFPADASGAARWFCDAPKTGCPMPRPRLGASCTPDGLQCDYSPCALPTGTSVVCKTGTWHEQMFACAQ